MNKYQQAKERARQAAINIQLTFSENSYSMSDLADFSTYFEKLGKRYGLIKEFKENGII